MKVHYHQIKQLKKKRKCKGLCNQETFIDRCCDNGTQIENYEQFENKKSTKTHIKINIDDSLQFNKDSNNVSVENEPIKKKEYSHKCKEDRNSKTYQIDTLEQPQHDHCYYCSRKTKRYRNISF